MDASGKFVDGHVYQDFRAYRDYLATHDDRLARACLQAATRHGPRTRLSTALLDRIVHDVAKNKHRVRDLRTVSLTHRFS